MPRFALFASALCLTLAAPVAQAAGTLKIAVVAPQTGNRQILGDQIRQGARLAADGKAEIVLVDESCEENSGAAIGRQIVEAKAAIAIGFLCTESLEGALPGLKDAKIPALTLSVRAPILMEDALKKGWPLFRLAPGPTAERDMIAEVVFRDWKDKPFALIDDGTITSRETAETVREALEAKGMRATLIDNFRPAQDVQTLLVRRLAKAGVTHVFAAADRADMAVMARDARAAGLKLTFLGGESLKAVEPGAPLERGVLAVTLPDFETLASARAVVDAMVAPGQPAEGYVLPAHAATSIAIEAKEIADGSGADLAATLVDTPFETAIGEIRFTAAHELSRNPLVLGEWDGTGFKPVPPSQ